MDTISEAFERVAAASRRKGFRDAQVDRLHDIADFGPNPGQLRCRAYVPAGLAPCAPLVVVLHGCTQTAAGYDEGAGWSALADEAGFALVFPEQQRSNNANLCFNWFEPGDIARAGGEAESIRSMIAHMVQAHWLDRTRIHVTGLSAGGAMAAVMLATYPEVFAGGAVIAGIPYASAGTVPEAFERMRGQGGPDAAGLAKLVRSASGHAGPWPRLSIWHGSTDRTVAFSNAQALADSWSLVIGQRAQATQVAQAGRHTTRSWLDADGSVRLELHSIDGMGHGTPIAPNGPAGSEAGNQAGGGRAMPYMLDVGVASTRWIASGWGIANLEGPAQPAAEQPAAADRRATPRPDTPKPSPFPSMGGFADQQSEGIRHTIEGALRAAGLMR